MSNLARLFNKNKISYCANKYDNYKDQNYVRKTFMIHMIKKFSSPKIKIWFEPMFLIIA